MAGPLSQAGELREEVVAGRCGRREFIFKLGAVIGKQPSWECACVCLHKPWGLDESGPQLAREWREQSCLPVCACLCPGGFGCGAGEAKDGQIQMIARLRQGRGWWWGGGKSFLQTPPGRCGTLPLPQHQSRAFLWGSGPRSQEMARAPPSTCGFSPACKSLCFTPYSSRCPHSCP